MPFAQSRTIGDSISEEKLQAFLEHTYAVERADPERASDMEAYRKGYPTSEPVVRKVIEEAVGFIHASERRTNSPFPNFSSRASVPPRQTFLPNSVEPVHTEHPGLLLYPSPHLPQSFSASHTLPYHIAVSPDLYPSISGILPGPSQPTNPLFSPLRDRAPMSGGLEHRMPAVALDQPATATERTSAHPIYQQVSGTSTLFLRTFQSPPPTAGSNHDLRVQFPELPSNGTAAVTFPMHVSTNNSSLELSLDGREEHKHKTAPPGGDDQDAASGAAGVGDIGEERTIHTVVAKSGRPTNASRQVVHRFCDQLADMLQLASCSADVPEDTLMKIFREHRGAGNGNSWNAFNKWLKVKPAGKFF
jgi:hypothetical protein